MFIFRFEVRYKLVKNINSSVLKTENTAVYKKYHMATYNSTTFGSISGRHGSAVATSGKTGNILRVFKAPANPNTEKQLHQRTKFGYVTNTLACMRELYKYTFRSKGGYNYGLSLAMKTAVTGTSPDYSIDYPKLKISEGGVYGSTVTLAKGANRKVVINWSITNIGSKASQAKSDDYLSIMLLNTDIQETMLFDHIAARQDGTVEIEVPEEWAGTLHSWVFFSRHDDTLQSDSIYAGELVY